MRNYIVVSMALAALVCAPAAAQTPIDSQAWLTERPTPNSSGAIRWRLSTETATAAPVIAGDSLSEREVSAIASQFDFYPFGEDFYLSAGTVAPRDAARSPLWARQSGQSAATAFPHAELVDDFETDGLERLTRYFGAGVTVRTMDDWSLTVEGGAYFQDSGDDRMVLFDPETGEHMPLLEDLDSVDSEAVGDTQARSVRPVGHLVLRRRF